MFFCFVEVMVSVQNNSVNNQMKTPELNIGVIVPPDRFIKPVIYSDMEATQKFKELNRDVYQMQKKVSFEDTKKTPKSVFYLLGAGVLTALGFGVRALIKKGH